MCRWVFVVCSTILMLAPHAYGKGIYLSEAQFLDRAFGSQIHQVQRWWWTDAARTEAEAIIQHPIRALRVRYWKAEGANLSPSSGSKTAWIFDEIGKEKPITIGVVIDSGRIQSVDILAFRESRGGEVRYPAFTRQFEGAALTEPHRLSVPIDGITGATMSVSAVKRVSALSLYLHNIVNNSPS